jgi:hypothetical protein
MQIILFDTKTKSKSIEQFMFMPWNMPTRHYPSYDIRGYPTIYPWNYARPQIPLFYWYPYFYEANGKYTYNPSHAKLLSNL